MTPRTLLPVALFALLGLALIGFWWPLPEHAGDAQTERPWALPEQPAPTKTTDMPDSLARFWPGRAPTDGATAQASAADSDSSGKPTDWRLIGIIHQGRAPSALVQDPQQNILTLKPGDRLDATRQVSRLEPTRLFWQGDDGTRGSLPLYPEPAPD